MAAPPPSSSSSSRVPIVLGTVFVALLAWLAWSFAGSDDARTPSDETSEAAAGSREQTRQTERGPARTKSEHASVAGRVRAREGEPLHDARVTLLPLAREGAEPIDVRCDDAGDWSIAALEPGRYAVSATASEHLPATRPELRVEAGAELRGVDLVLERGGSLLSGRIHDLTGGEIEGARVQITPVGGLARVRERESFFALSDAEGRYAVQVPEGRFRVRAGHPDYSSVEVVLELATGARTHDFELVPMAVIEGVVVRASDRSPVADASVSWSREVTRQRGLDSAVVLEPGGMLRSDAEGRFRIRGLLPGTVLIAARGPALASQAPTAVPIAIAERVEGVEILVDAALDLRGRVVSEDDASVGVAGAELVLGNDAGPRVRALADAEGRFVIHGVLPGSYQLDASAEGWLSSAPTPVRVDAERSDEPTIALSRGRMIRGRVDPAGAAVIGLEMAPTELDLGPGAGPRMGVMMMRAMTAEASSDPATGRFELGPVGPGHYTLVATASDGRGGKLEVEVAASDVEDVVIHLDARAKVSGLVRDAQGQPVAGASVLARRVRDDRAKVQVIVDGRELTANAAPTSDTGQYELLGLESGAWTLEVRDAHGDVLAWAEGGQQPLALTLGEAEQRTLDLRVEASDGRVSGTLRDAEGKPVADAWVSIRSTPELRPPPAPSADEGPRSEMVMMVESDVGLGHGDIPPTLTDAQGRFAFERLRRGPHLVVAELHGSKASKAAVIPDADIVLELAPLGRIEGSVLAAAGEDCMARACLVRLGGPSARSGTARAGSFEFERLEPGRYMITIKTSTGGTSVEVDVEAGRTATAELTIQRFARVRGRMLGSDDQPVVGALVLVGDSPSEGMIEISQDGSEEPIVTDAEGRFDVAAAPGGRVILVLDPKQPQPLALEFLVIESGKDVDLGDLHPAPPDAFGPGPNAPEGPEAQQPAP